MTPQRRIGRSALLCAALLAGLALGALRSAPAHAASAAELDASASAALQQLYRSNATAKLLGEHAKGVLVFPRIWKAGFMFGGQIGEGVLSQAGRTAGYYNSVAASYGLQAGVQSFGYALFFMSDAALAYLAKSKGFEIGVGPSVVLVDQGVASNLTSTTLKDEVYAVVFDQKGLMAGIGIQGSKITRISK